jgi:protease-4
MANDFFKVIGIFIALMIFTAAAAYMLGSIFSGSTGNVAVIKIEGEIVSGESDIFLTGAAASDTIINQIADAKNNPEVEAVIFDINSPGGGIVATKEILTAVKSINKTKVCLLRETAASGAYWIASACDRIIANEFTITGSIGVTGGYLEFSKLMEKYGISYVRLVSGEKKDMGTPYREPTAEELAQLNAVIKEIHESFVADVAQNRNLPVKKVADIADGSIFTGKQAIELGLVDMLGGKQEAVNSAAELANLSETKVFVYKEAPSFWEILSEVTAKGLVKYFAANQLSIKV